MSTFQSLLRRADTLRRSEDDPLRESWWIGYIRGLRRAHHGERYGTDAEHDLYVSAIESSDASRAALGRGYRAGLTLEPRDPDEPIEITVPNGTPPVDWQKAALRLARAEAAQRGIAWRDADVFVHLPERGRCYTKRPGFDTLGAHG